jgi:PPM family protein phosphatase
MKISTLNLVRVVMNEVVWFTNKGLVRENNEDCILVNGEIYTSGFGIESVEVPILLAMCDGLGGHQGGEIASFETLSLLNEHAFELIDSQTINNCINEIHQHIQYRQTVDSVIYNMATTLAGIVINDDSVIIFNVGDTRVYRFRYPYLMKLSVDHTLDHDLDLDLTDGKVTGVITRCIGGNNATPSVHEMNNTFHEQEIYLILSDGIYGFVDDSKIEQILVKYTSLTTVTSELLLEAAKSHSNDNMSLIILRRNSTHDNSSQ